MMKAIRGAHTAAANTAEMIRSCTLELLQAILAEMICGRRRL